MNYERIHWAIIENRKRLGRPEGYTENHHILPESFGGVNDKENMIRLTAKEHFIIHRLLAKMHPNTGMVHAVWKMACMNKANQRFKITSRTYEVLRKEHARRVSEDKVSARKKSDTMKGRKQTCEHVAKRAKSRKENGEWHTEETKKKISDGNMGKVGPWAGKKLPQDLIAKRNATRMANDNYRWSEEARQTMSEKLKGRKRGPKSEEHKANQRKRYLVNETIVVTNAKEYCKMNNLHYQKFITAANQGNLYKGLRITKDNVYEQYIESNECNF